MLQDQIYELSALGVTLSILLSSFLWSCDRKFLISVIEFMLCNVSAKKYFEEVH